jgi:hypothetical protein
VGTATIGACDVRVPRCGQLQRIVPAARKPPIRRNSHTSPGADAVTAHGRFDTAQDVWCSYTAVKEFHGSATRVVAAPFEACLTLVRAVDGYPVWCPEMVREVEVLQRDARGHAITARTKLHVARGPLVKDFDLVMAIVLEPPGTVKLTRVASEQSANRFDVTWRLRDTDGTRIELLLYASLGVSRFLPVGGVGDAIADRFVAAASTALGADPRS